MSSNPWRGRAASALAGAALAVAVTANLSSLQLSGGSYPSPGAELPAGDGAAVDSTAYGLGSSWHVLDWGPGQLAAVPAAGSYNTVDAHGRTVKRIMLSTGANPDVGSAASNNNMSVSNDSGLTFPNTEQHSAAMALNLARLRDGRIMSIDFIPEAAAASGNTTLTLDIRTSTDGDHWKLAKAPLAAPDGKTISWLRVHRRIIELADGTLLVPAYGVFDGSAKQYSTILQSTDGGKSWTFRSIIPVAGATGTNEVGWSYTSDGRLFAALRTAPDPSSLDYSVSADDGRTWSEAQPLLGPDGKQVQGIYPDVLLQPNGTLLLATGRPDDRVLVSYDGTGNSWQVQDTVFANAPAPDGVGNKDGSSGNSSLENVGASSSLLFFDQCHVWGCAVYNEQFGIDAQQVGVVTPGDGRIDVMSRVLDKTDTITGTFARPDKRFPEMRPAGAFDGSSAYGAEARITGTRTDKGQLVLTLDRAYSIDRVGLMLGHGEPQSAQVLLSADGRTWSKPVVDARNRSDRAMKYTTFAPQTARYVKVLTPAGTTTTLSELELYSSDLDGFENELPFSVPRGWTDAEHTWVTNVPANTAYNDFGGYHSETSLRLWDKYTDANAHITRPTPSTQSLHAEMMWGSAGGAQTDFTVAVDGTTSDGRTVQPWQFRLDRPGATTAVEANNGSGWVKLGTMTSPVPSRTYLPLSIDATPTSATLTVAGSSFTTTTPTATVESVGSIGFTTGDPAQSGAVFMIDDFSVSTSDAGYSVGVPDPQQGVTLPGLNSVVTVPVSNSGSAAKTLPVSVNVPAGYSAQAPASVTVPAHGTAKVDVAITGSTTSAGTATIEVRVGDQSRTLWLTATDDWVRGAAMTASSSNSSSSPENLNDGKTDTTVWGSAGSGAWNDNTAGTFPDWVQATWQQSVTLGRVDVYTIGTATYPAAQYGVRDYDVQVLAADGTWTTVAQVRGNTAAKVSSTFTPVQTTALRILVTDSNDHSSSRLISVQAFSS